MKTPRAFLVLIIVVVPVLFCFLNYKFHILSFYPAKPESFKRFIVSSKNELDPDLLLLKRNLKKLPPLSSNLNMYKIINLDECIPSLEGFLRIVFYNHRESEDKYSFKINEISGSKCIDIDIYSGLFERLVINNHYNQEDLEILKHYIPLQQDKNNVIDIGFLHGKIAVFLNKDPLFLLVLKDNIQTGKFYIRCVNPFSCNKIRDVYFFPL